MARSVLREEVGRREETKREGATEGGVDSCKHYIQLAQLPG